MNIENKSLAYGVAEAAKESGLGRSTLYDFVASGALPARKVGKRTLILHDDLIAFLKALPSFREAKTDVAANRSH